MKKRKPTIMISVYADERFYQKLIREAKRRKLSLTRTVIELCEQSLGAK